MFVIFIYFKILENRFIPSSLEINLSIILSGCGIIPRIFFSSFNIPAIFLDPGNGNSTISHEQENHWIREIKASNPDLVVLAGFMRIISKRFLKEFDFKVINLHPSLLPSFPGLNSIEKAFNKKVKITGCTVHWVNEEVDGGEIIAQAPVRIMDGDNLELVKQKIHAAEHMLLPWVIRDLAHGTIAFGK